MTWADVPMWFWYALNAISVLFLVLIVAACIFNKGSKTPTDSQWSARESDEPIIPQPANTR